MRKIISRHEIEKSNRKKQAIVGIVLVGLMLVSVLGYAFQVNPNTDANVNTGSSSYKGYELYSSNGFWNLKVGNNVFVFFEHPLDSLVIESELNSADSYSGKILYLYSENDEAEAEIYRNMIVLSSEIKEACPEGEICDSNLPIKNCDENFIIIKESDEISVEQNNKCVYISGPSESMTKIADGFILKILGI